MVLSDKAYFIKKAATALKCTLTSFLINLWYPLAALYIILQMFDAEAFIGGFIDLYYPVLCSCKIEMNTYATGLAVFLTFGGANRGRCFDEDDSNVQVDCDTGDPVLIYDTESCLESITWFKCTREEEGDWGFEELFGAEREKYWSLDRNCVTPATSDVSE